MMCRFMIIPRPNFRGDDVNKGIIFWSDSADHPKLLISVYCNYVTKCRNELINKKPTEPKEKKTFQLKIYASHLACTKVNFLCSIGGSFK